ncbi:MAG TPA: hypothetical protein VK864_06865, partial [Longimicrobiales bacterium]|nr:hypothetical protein [Longimicrobiales bacterium]
GSDLPARRTLEELLAEQLGRSVQLEVRPIGGPAQASELPPRLTVEGVKRDQLTRLAATEPTLKKAVEEWKLELLE